MLLFAMACSALPLCGPTNRSMGVIFCFTRGVSITCPPCTDDGLLGPPPSLCRTIVQKRGQVERRIGVPCFRSDSPPLLSLSRVTLRQEDAEIEGCGRARSGLPSFCCLPSSVFGLSVLLPAEI